MQRGKVNSLLSRPPLTRWRRPKSKDEEVDRKRGGHLELEPENRGERGLEGEAHLAAHIRFVTVPAPAPGRVHPDHTQIGQILLNLAVNAQRRHGGRRLLRLETDNLAEGDLEEVREVAPEAWSC
jgi:hypothetical protein